MNSPNNPGGQSLQDASIDIVLAADRNYAMPMCVAICSTAINCAAEKLLRFHVIESGFGLELKQRISDSLNRIRPINSKIYWYPLASELVADLAIVQGHINSTAYSRLLIPQLLSPTITRALYLDSDLVVEGNISELWEGYKFEKALGAVRDRIGTVGALGGLSNYSQLGISPDQPYFNSGVLLLNVAKWREQSISERVFAYLRSYKHLLQFEDQEGLNAILHNDWDEIPKKWNQQIVPLSLRSRPDVALNNSIEGGIIHFITSEKPWSPGCKYLERQRFFHYLDKTDWQGWRVPLWREMFARSKRVLSDMRRSLLTPS
jgi:lipopolysaccharide biosynthesis glycosyltransferase